MQKSDEVILMWLTAESNPSTVLDSTLTRELKSLGLDKASSSWFQTVNSTFLTTIWNISPFNLTTSGNILSGMWYRWHRCKLCFDCTQALYCCSLCTRIAGERSNSASSAFRTDCWWCSLHDGDDLSHFPAYPFGMQGRVTAEWSFSCAQRSICQGETGLRISSSFWVQGLSWVLRLKSQNWELLCFHGGRETIRKRDHNGCVFVFYPTPRTCFWTPHWTRKRGDNYFCSFF